jgi:hypothetical protein
MRLLFANVPARQGGRLPGKPDKSRVAKRSSTGAVGLLPRRRAISNPESSSVLTTDKEKEDEEKEDYYQRLLEPSTEFTESCFGREEHTSVLLHAMRIQWKHGYTHVPSGFRRVTHGFGEILAGMQPAAAERCVELLLGGEGKRRRSERKRGGSSEYASSEEDEEDDDEEELSILDPFCGGGTVPVVAMTNNMTAYGTDVSPLALHVCGHRVWVPENVEKEEEWLRARMSRIEAIMIARSEEEENEEASNTQQEEQQQKQERRRDLPGSFASIATAVEKAILESDEEDGAGSSRDNDSSDRNSTSVDATTRKTALFFCLTEAERRHFVRQKRNKRKKRFGKRRASNGNGDKDDSYYSPLSFYQRCVDEYIFRVKDLHDAVNGKADVCIRKGDARFDDLVPKDKIGTISGILTSPPYPGVYDYVSFARKQRSRFRGVGTTTAKTEGETRLKPPTSYYVDAKVPSSNELDENGNRASWSDDFSSVNEFGAKRELRKDPSTFNDKWTQSQNQWLSNAYRTLKPSGRMLVMIGDGANVDALKSTVACAETAGFTLLASCSLALLRTMESTGTVYNGARKEHLILFEK